MSQPPIEQQMSDWQKDNLSDAELAEEQAKDEHGTKKAELLAYAAECRANVANPHQSLPKALRGSGIPVPPAPEK